MSVLMRSIRYVGLRLLAGAGLVAVGGVTVGLYGLGRSQVVEDIYRRKLSELYRRHEALQTRYDRAVAQTAVTELDVKAKGIDLVIRGMDGELHRVETDLDPASEIHVDYVVMDGRLYIRRVYDDATPPRHAAWTDPRLQDVDWDRTERGLSVYRGRLQPGRWVVSTSGNGALNLKRSEGLPPTLARPPPIESFDTVTRTVDRRVAQVSTMEVLQELASGLLGDASNPGGTTAP